MSEFWTVVEGDDPVRVEAKTPSDAARQAATKVMADTDESDWTVTVDVYDYKKRPTASFKVRQWVEVHVDVENCPDREPPDFEPDSD